jgi:hypothetical protein
MSVDDRTSARPDLTAVQIDEIEVRLAGRVACPWCAGLSVPGPSCDTCGSPLDEQEAARLTAEFREALENRIVESGRADLEAKKLEEQQKRDEVARRRQEAVAKREQDRERKKREAQELAARLRARASALEAEAGLTAAPPVEAQVVAPAPVQAQPVVEPPQALPVAA